LDSKPSIMLRRSRRAVMTLAVLLTLSGIPLGFENSSASAQTLEPHKPARLKTTPPAARAPSTRSSNPCAQFGPGFAVVDGTSSCVKIGGSTSVTVGGGR
jgi:hypothetical protein